MTSKRGLGTHVGRSGEESKEARYLKNHSGTEPRGTAGGRRTMKQRLEGLVETGEGRIEELELGQVAVLCSSSSSSSRIIRAWLPGLVLRQNKRKSALSYLSTKKITLFSTYNNTDLCMTTDDS